MAETRHLGVDVGGTKSAVVPGQREDGGDVRGVDSFGITGAMVVPFLACLHILFLGRRSMRDARA